jgi:multidrug efflux pump subunit AcrA (membrane-fusion protein)
MSADQVNSDTIEQTKQQIRGLVSEIAQLSKSDLEAEEYYSAFLQRIVSALAAVGGAVWVIKEGRRLDLAYQIKMSETLLDPASEEAGRHFGLLTHVIGTGEPRLVPPQSGAGEDQAVGNPTRFLLVIAPLRGDNQIEGVVEIFQRPEAQPVTQRGYLKFLIQMCELASEWLKTRRLRQITDRHSLWAQADHFARMVHENLDLRETAYTVVNEGRRIVGCDRVSVGIMRGRKCVIEAVSGQDAIENRSNIANYLGQLATRVVATGESLWYEGSAEDLPPQVEEALDRYIDESHSKMLMVLPLRRPKRPEDVQETATGEADAESNVANEVIGALIVEQIESDLPEAIVRARTDLVYEHSSRALTNALDYNRIFLMPVWRTIGKMRWLVQARMLPKTVIVLIALVVLSLLLVFYPKDFHLRSDATLQPVSKRDVFVPVDGDVIEVLVKDQQTVEAGQPLVKLRSTELEVQYQEVTGQLQQKRERRFAVNLALMTKMSEGERARTAGEANELKQEIASLEIQARLLREKRAKLEICSPIDGEVMMAWDVQKTLLRRPVTTGQLLMSVADPNGPWELELEMRESRAGKVRDARRQMLAKRAQAGGAAPASDALVPGESVTYVLAKDPEVVRKGQITEIKDITEVLPEKGPINRMKAAIDLQDIGHPHPGATATARVYAGRRALGYVYLHEFWEWIETNVLFYLF